MSSFFELAYGQPRDSFTSRQLSTTFLQGADDAVSPDTTTFRTVHVCHTWLPSSPRDHGVIDISHGIAEAVPYARHPRRSGLPPLSPRFSYPSADAALSMRRCRRLSLAKSPPAASRRVQLPSQHRSSQHGRAIWNLCATFHPLIPVHGCRSTQKVGQPCSHIGLIA